MFFRVTSTLYRDPTIDDYISSWVFNDEPWYRDLKWRVQGFIQFQPLGFAADTPTGEEVEPDFVWRLHATNLLTN